MSVNLGGDKMLEVVFKALISFISTNMDDIFVLMILYAQVASKKGWIRIIAGQYLGTYLLTGISILGAFGMSLLPSKYIGLLGIVPIFLGIRTWITSKRSTKEDGDSAPQENASISVLGVTLFTIMNGADNIGVYIPVFSRYSMMELVLTSLVFGVMIALWCLIGFKLANYPFIKNKIQKYQHIIVPSVLIVLGLFIILENYIIL